MFAMGKINNSVEIIPIDGPSGLHSRQIEQQRAADKMNYLISDPFIVQRVRQVKHYLSRYPGKFNRYFI